MSGWFGTGGVCDNGNNALNTAAYEGCGTGGVPASDTCGSGSTADTNNTHCLTGTGPNSL
ncbi:MAG: hypothetical protein ABIA04_02650 [Pseudomonadota bacterium]